MNKPDLVVQWACVVLTLTALAILLGVGCVVEQTQYPVDGEPDPPPFFAAFGHSIHTSVDGINWKRRESPFGNFQGAAYGDKRIVAIGGDDGGDVAVSVAVSEDGARWREINPESLIATSAVAYGADKFVAVGEVFEGLRSIGLVFTSPDGVAWTQRAEGPFEGLHSVVYGGSKFVAVGLGQNIVTSLDGVVWSKMPFEHINQLFDVVYGSDTFVVTANHGSVFTSSDGFVWEVRESGVSRLVFLKGVAYGNGLFVAVGDEYDSDRRISVSTIITSPDGVGWDVQHSADSQSLSDVSFGDDSFVVVGQNETRNTQGNVTSSTAIVLTSPDGIDWAMTEIPGAVWLSSVTYWPALD